MATQSVNLISVPVQGDPFVLGALTESVSLITVQVPGIPFVLGALTEGVSLISVPVQGASFNPYPGPGGGGGVTVTFTNRVWNTTNSGWVRWDTTPSPDPLGSSYPGPGTFGVDTQTPAHVERTTTVITP